MSDEIAVGSGHPHPEDPIITCLICKVAWNLDMDPPLCENPEHPQAPNLISEWSTPGKGLP